ncbi:MAG TPA: acyl-CoA dehydrogenase family protein [Rhizomicrobium sp.]|nr:acyl-CoA dehydrogenase family protein [Rhizomicrobium sp.]
MSRPQRNHQDRGIFEEEHHAFRETVARFYAKEVEPNVSRWEAQGIYDRDLFYKAGEAGILCPGIPEEYGGGGGDVLHHFICYEEHGYSERASGFEGIDTDSTSYLILSAGTEDQKRRWLPKYARGEVVVEGAFSEPHSGSDVGSMRTHAVRDGDSYILNGSKIWITNTNLLDLCLVVARTSREAEPKQFSMFIVDMTLPGVSRGRPIRTMHRGPGNLGEIFFDNVRVPATELLGGRKGSGLKQGGHSLNVSRLALSARIIASCERALELTLDFVRDRRAFGQRIFDFQNTQFKLADIRTQIEVGRAFVDKCMLKALHNRLTPAEASMAKLWTSEIESGIMDTCVQLHGAMGLSHEHPISQMFTGARSHRIMMGTSEMQRQTILRVM